MGLGLVGKAVELGKHLLAIEQFAAACLLQADGNLAANLLKNGLLLLQEAKTCPNHLARGLIAPRLHARGDELV